MKKKSLQRLLGTVTLPPEHAARQALYALSPFERVLLGALVAVLIGSTLALLSRVNSFLLVEVPREGGSLTEGVVGSPRFINPLLDVSDADRDLTALVYAGLLRAQPDGTLAPELAERYRISSDGLTYTFTLRDGIAFHDGEPVTADDVVFTVRLAQDNAIKSPKRASWEGVTAEQLSEREVQFTLQQPYSPFLENMTLGILPKHVWEGVSAEQFPFSQFNIEPVGAGPYKMARIERNSAGLPRSYKLTSFEKYALGEPFISSITLRFFAGEDNLIQAYRDGEVEAVNSISPERVGELGESARIVHTPLSRIFAVFFNQSQAPLFSDQRVREALDVALDKARVVEEVLGGYGAAIYNPIPPGILSQTDPGYANLTSSERLARAEELLAADGWEKNDEGMLEKETDDEGSRPFRFSIATSNTPELKAAANLIKEQWNRLGAHVELQFFDTADLSTNVIRPRRYDALLFGEIVGRELDLFAFWHSSQRNDPGLNVALYANITADKLLEDARQEQDRESRLEQYAAFEEEVRNDMPSIFVYTPNFIYIVPEKLKGLELGTIATPADRFLNVHEWFIEMERVWLIFNREPLQKTVLVKPQTNAASTFTTQNATEVTTARARGFTRRTSL